MALNEAVAASTMVIACSYAGWILLRDLPKLKILRSVVKLVSISVVHAFVRLQQATKLLFHNETVLQYVPLGSGMRMLGHVQVPVARAVNETSFPFEACLTTRCRATAMSFSPWTWVPFETAILALSVRTNWGGQSTPTFTKPIRNIFRKRNESTVMTLNEVSARGGFLSTTTHALVHRVASAASPVYSRG
jgi:hypothetical protein